MPAHPTDMITPTGQSTRLNIFSFKAPHMRTFHITWLTFFLCFFGWFGIAPLMPLIQSEFHLTQAQTGHIVIASVGVTLFARLLIGWLCDRWGPRRAYVAILITGALPVMLIGCAHDYESFLLFRLLTGILGASFVVTQYHTAIMFAPRIVGMANATAAGWGNMGGGVTQIIMPLICAAFMTGGLSPEASWRLSMVIPGVALLVMAVIYYHGTQDTPHGNFHAIKRPSPSRGNQKKKDTWEVYRDRRVWLLFLAYGACFGVELIMESIASLYFMANFKIGLKAAGLIAGGFGCLNIFARSAGGILSDKMGKRLGIKGRVSMLSLALLLQGTGMLLFSQATSLIWAVVLLLSFGLFLQMSTGATYAIVPFIHHQALGTVSGMVGAGGNAGAVAIGFLLATDGLSYRQGLWIGGWAVCIIAVLSALVALQPKKYPPTTFRPALPKWKAIQPETTEIYPHTGDNP